MTFNLINWLMLSGMAAVVIPPLIHLFNRRRYDVVDWGAMQFLQVSSAKRRRLLLEELLLMGLRMLLIAVMVLALCAPYAVSDWFSAIGLVQHRDVVLVFGGSAGMEATGANEAAKKWAVEFLATLSPGDKVAILQAKKQVVPVLVEPTGDFHLARKSIEDLPAPGGGCDWTLAVRQAHQILEKSERPLRDIILLGNGQRNGWADAESLDDWEILAGQTVLTSEIKPSLWAVNFDPKRPANSPNWSLAPLRTPRLAVHVNQVVEFQTALLFYGLKRYEPPERIDVEIDGDFAGRRALGFPGPEELANRQPAPVVEEPGHEKQGVLAVPLPPFRQKFKTPGSHLISVFARLKSGRVIRQDHALPVLPLPVLIVDGEPTQTVKRRRSDFLRLALDPRRDAATEAPSAVLARVVSYQDFDGRLLNQDIDRVHAGTRPRVLVLADVPRLTESQRQAVSQFLTDGGGLLITLGDQAEQNQDHYNKDLYQEGKGWLPASLQRVGKGGTTADVRLLPSFQHPALELFRKEAVGGLNDVSFPRWWTVAPSEKDGAVTVARLSSQDPWLVERNFQGARVLLCTVPLMNSWDTQTASWDSNLIRLPVYAPLIHELVHYLAGNLATREKNQLRINFNLRPGQPLYHVQDGTEAMENWSLQVPGDKEPKPLLLGPGPRLPGEHRARILNGARAPGTPSASSGPLVDYPDTYHTGVYTLNVPLKNNWLDPVAAHFFNDTLSSRRTVFYTVQSDDLREFDLTPWTAADRKQVAQRVPITYEDDSRALLMSLANQANKQELWWLFMVAVVALLCCEVWMTRRIVRARH